MICNYYIKNSEIKEGGADWFLMHHNRTALGMEPIDGQPIYCWRFGGHRGRHEFNQTYPDWCNLSDVPRTDHSGFDYMLGEIVYFGHGREWTKGHKEIIYDDGFPMTVSTYKQTKRKANKPA